MYRTKDLIKSPSKLIKKAQDLIEQVFQEQQGEGDVIQQSPIWIRATTWGLMGTAAFAVAWLAVAKTDEIISVTGKLEPLGSVQEIQMPTGGIASKILVKDGDEVKAGDIVMRLDGEATEQRLNSLKESKKLKTQQLELKQLELRQYLLLNEEETKTLSNNLRLQQEILSRYEILNKEGAASELQFLQQLYQVEETSGTLNQVRIDGMRQRAAQNQQIQQLKAELQELQAQITEASVNIRYQALRSPVDGIVFDLKPRGEGYVAQSTET